MYLQYENILVVCKLIPRQSIVLYIISSYYYLTVGIEKWNWCIIQ